MRGRTQRRSRLHLGHGLTTIRLASSFPDQRPTRAASMGPAAQTEAVASCDDIAASPLIDRRPLAWPSKQAPPPSREPSEMPGSMSSPDPTRREPPRRSVPSGAGVDCPGPSTMTYSRPSDENPPRPLKNCSAARSAAAFSNRGASVANLEVVGGLARRGVGRRSS
jgi:hypothetical protein